jgi:hypothetical protein
MRKLSRNPKLTLDTILKYKLTQYAKDICRMNKYPNVIDYFINSNLIIIKDIYLNVNLPTEYIFNLMIKYKCIWIDHNRDLPSDLIIDLYNENKLNHLEIAYILDFRTDIDFMKFLKFKNTPGYLVEDIIQRYYKYQEDKYHENASNSNKFYDRSTLCSDEWHDILKHPNLSENMKNYFINLPKEKQKYDSSYKKADVITYIANNNNTSFDIVMNNLNNINNTIFNNFYTYIERNLNNTIFNF